MKNFSFHLTAGLIILVAGLLLPHAKEVHQAARKEKQDKSYSR